MHNVSFLYCCLVAITYMATICHGIPKKYDTDGGFLPSSTNFYQQGDQIAMESSLSKTATNLAKRSDDVSASETNAVDKRPQEPRFGFAFPGGIQNQNHGNGNSVYPGYSGQLNLDLGGLILGAIVGLGAVFILPKILHVFSDHHHSDHYKRSDDKESKVMQILTKVDETLSKYNIDSSSCIQRAVCSYVKTSSTKVTEGKASNFDAFVDIASSNSIMGYMLDGSTIKKAVDKGRKGENCGQAYPKCPFNQEIVFAAVKGLIGEQLMKE